MNNDNISIEMVKESANHIKDMNHIELSELIMSNINTPMTLALLELYNSVDDN